MKAFESALFFLLILLAACQREAAVPDVPEDKPGLIEHTLYASTPGGAKLLPALGGECYFQWGRKDPLISGRPVMDHPGDAAAHFASIRNPGSFIDKGTNCADWYAAESYEHQDSLLWGGAGGAKTVWDPCPAGWRVPRESDFEGVTESYADSFEKLGVLLPDGAVTAPTLDYGWDANCWARNKTDNNSWYLWMQTDGEGFLGFSIEGNARYQGLSVRCIKEKE